MQASKTLTNDLQDVQDEVDEEDATTADILHATITKLEQFAWMVGAENMTPEQKVASPSSGKNTSGKGSGSGSK